MAFTDPISLTVATVARSLAKIFSPNSQGRYQKSDGTELLTIGHTPFTQAKTGEARIRHMGRLDVSATVLNPVSNSNEVKRLGVYFVIDRPVTGFTNAQVVDYAVGLFDWGKASSNAALNKIVSQEV
jgi:hypothetical protein